MDLSERREAIRREVTAFRELVEVIEDVLGGICAQSTAEARVEEILARHLPRGAVDASELDRLRAGVSWARGMLTDTEPPEKVDAFLGRLLDPAALDEDLANDQGDSPA